MPTPPPGCLSFLFRFFQSTPANPTAPFPNLQLNKYFISNAEADFFRVLKKVVDDRGHILAQVSLRQLLWFPGTNQSNPGRQTWQNKSAAKSLDFLICDPATLRPKLAIELDESSHNRQDRIERDKEVKALMEASGLPFLRFPTQASYDTRELQAALAPHMILKPFN